MLDFDALSSSGHAACFASRGRIPEEAAARAGFPDTASWLADLASRTCCVTMLAGAGTRWVESLRTADPRPDFDPARPRGLFSVRNVMGAGPDPVPIAAYALAATRDLGDHIVVVRGWEDEIRSLILEPIGYRPGGWRFATQEAPGGKPRGHGDAAWQTMDLWSGYEYLAVNFGGDASNPASVLYALAALDALSRRSARTDAPPPALVLPVAWMENPAYPIGLDSRGLPVRFGHAKLQGGSVTAGGGAFTNVGVRVYRVDALREAILRIRAAHWTAGGGWRIPGNAPPGSDDPSGGEFALDNVDAALAAEGRARILHVALPQELSPVKTLADIPRFERDVAVIYG